MVSFAIVVAEQITASLKKQGMTKRVLFLGANCRMTQRMKFRDFEIYWIEGPKKPCFQICLSAFFMISAEKPCFFNPVLLHYHAPKWIILQLNVITL